MRILITGASGFLGAPLLRRLDHGGGHDLFVLPSPHFRARALDGVRYRTVDTPEAARAELIYHLASPAIDAPEAEQEAAIAGGMRRLLEAAAAHSPRLVFTGSAAEYGSGHGWRETDPPRPDTRFGQWKSAAAEMARASGRVHLVHLRLFTPYGEGEAPGRLIPSAARAALAGEPVRLRTTGEQTRDYFHADDAVEALIEAGRRALEPGVVINVCSGQARRAVDVAQRVAALAGRGSIVVPGAARPAALAELSGDPARAAELLGWRPRIGFDEGLRRVLASLDGGGGTAPHTPPDRVAHAASRSAATHGQFRSSSRLLTTADVGPLSRGRGSVQSFTGQKGTHACH